MTQIVPEESNDGATKTGTVCRSRQIRNEGSEGVCDADVQLNLWR